MTGFRPGLRLLTWLGLVLVLLGLTCSGHDLAHHDLPSAACAGTAALAAVPALSAAGAPSGRVPFAPVLALGTDDPRPPDPPPRRLAA